MRSLVRAAVVVAMLFLPCVAHAWYQGEATATIANLASFVGAGRTISNGSSATVLAYVQFTTAATGGTVDGVVDLSADGATWVLGAGGTFSITCTAANTYMGTASLAATQKAPKARIRLTNNLTGTTKTATSVYLGFIVN